MVAWPPASSIDPCRQPTARPSQPPCPPDNRLSKKAISRNSNSPLKIVRGLPIQFGATASIRMEPVPGGGVTAGSIYPGSAMNILDPQGPIGAADKTILID